METDFRIWQDVTVHPASDLWMKGVRYGVITAIGRKYITITDMHGRAFKVRPSSLIHGILPIQPKP